MDQQHFMKSVAERVGLNERDQVRDGVHASLRTLAERITPGEAEDLAAQLPPELGGVVADNATGPERFDRTELVHRVASRSGLDPDLAERMAGAVFAVLGTAVSAGEIADVRTQLPADIASLFDAA